MNTSSFHKELETLLNRHSMESGSDTPDFILAEYLTGCLGLFDATVRRRSKWYGGSGRTTPPPDSDADCIDDMCHVIATSDAAKLTRVRAIMAEYNALPGSSPVIDGRTLDAVSAAVKP